MGKPIEVTNVQYPVAMAEPLNSSGPVSKGTVFAVGFITGAVLFGGGVSCENQGNGDSKSGDPKVSVQVEK